MTIPDVAVRQEEVRLDADPAEACARLRKHHPVTLLFDGRGGFDESWATGPLLALWPEVCLEAYAGDGGALDRLERMILERRGAGGTGETGIAALLTYEALDPAAARRRPEIVAFRVDGSVRFDPAGPAMLTRRGNGASTLPSPARVAEALRGNSDVQRGVTHPLRSGRPTTSLPRERYLRTVQRVLRHIAAGDIYQANLCQQFRCGYTGDAFELYRALSARTAAPQSAFVETSRTALASVSPERFVRVRPSGTIETWPIKGTRPRQDDPARDLAAARELEASAKDRAELLMIVDLERNDLSRICEAGTVRVEPLAGLRSYANVHHLVAGVHGRLRRSAGPADVIRAGFPGGSITGAPKIRAMEILRELEPVRRRLFTGSLFWFADDGSMDSSILIRSWELDGATALLGAGGGIVADSDPEAEWQESNAKARALAGVLGFDPEEAG